MTPDEQEAADWARNQDAIVPNPAPASHPAGTLLADPEDSTRTYQIGDPVPAWMLASMRSAGYDLAADGDLDAYCAHYLVRPRGGK